MFPLVGGPGRNVCTPAQHRSIGPEAALWWVPAATCVNSAAHGVGPSTIPVMISSGNIRIRHACTEADGTNTVEFHRSPPRRVSSGSCRRSALLAQPTAKRPLPEQCSRVPLDRVRAEAPFQQRPMVFDEFLRLQTGRLRTSVRSKNGAASGSPSPAPPTPIELRGYRRRVASSGQSVVGAGPVENLQRPRSQLFERAARPGGLHRKSRPHLRAARRVVEEATASRPCRRVGRRIRPSSWRRPCAIRTGACARVFVLSATMNCVLQLRGRQRLHDRQRAATAGRIAAIECARVGVASGAGSVAARRCPLRCRPRRRCRCRRPSSRRRSRGRGSPGAVWILRPSTRWNRRA